MPYTIAEIDLKYENCRHYKDDYRAKIIIIILNNDIKAIKFSVNNNQQQQKAIFFIIFIFKKQNYLLII